MRTKKSKIKIRKSTRYFYITFASVLFVVSFCSLFGSFLGGKTDKTKKEIYSYKNSFNYDYTVKLLENKYIEETELGMNETAYITDLIDNINMNLNYTYTADTKSTIKYTYNIKGIIQGTYEKDGKSQSVWNREYVLKEPTEEAVLGTKLEIKENLELNLAEQNKLVADFEKDIGISVNAVYNIVLEVNTNTEIDGEKVSNVQKSIISIDLGKKTTTITGENNKEETKYVSKEIENNITTSSIGTVVSVICLVISLLIYRYVFTKTTIINKTRNEFRLELNRILRLCQDKIVRVNSRLEVDTTNVVDVKDFGEIIKVSEELFKPILYWQSKSESEAWFTVMSNGVTYRYILRKG